VARRTPAVSAASFEEIFNGLVSNIERVIQGKREVIQLALTCLVADGHLLIEDVPGVGKTMLAKAISRTIDGSWHRIQFTPDLLPSDVTGVSVWNRGTNEFEFRPGGVFANIVLADEVNRASPKTQSALLEAMEERQVTVDAVTHPLQRPFMVIATQNPIEYEGTYPLPEAQLDRFLMRVRMGYPDRAAGIDILEAHGIDEPVSDLTPVLKAAEVMKLSESVTHVYVAPSLKGYIVDLVEATRHERDLALGVSPRGTLALQRAARAWAAANGRDYITPDDLKFLAGTVLEHRLILAPEAQLRGATARDVLDTVLDRVPVPSVRAGAGAS
jgi:MoxR-like ATPase